jgi:hypothetical protein
MLWWWGYTEPVSPRPPRLHRISSLLGRFGHLRYFRFGWKRTLVNQCPMEERLKLAALARRGNALPSDRKRSPISESLEGGPERRRAAAAEDCSNQLAVRHPA